jgi:hypothetical protein
MRESLAQLADVDTAASLARLGSASMHTADDADRTASSASVW